MHNPKITQHVADSVVSLENSKGPLSYSRLIIRQWRFLVGLKQLRRVPAPRLVMFISALGIEC